MKNELNRVIRGFNRLFESIKAGVNDFSASLGFGDVIVGGAFKSQIFSKVLLKGLLKMQGRHLTERQSFEIRPI